MVAEQFRGAGSGSGGWARSGWGSSGHGGGGGEEGREEVGAAGELGFRRSEGAGVGEE
jgi:hypothetical protein